MENLKLALKAACIDELRCLPSEEELKAVICISSAFENRMSRLFRRGTSSVPKCRVKRMVMVAILAALMASVMSVQAIREPIVKFFLDVHERCTDIIFQTAEDEKIEEYDFFIPDPPEGYSETNREELQTQVKAEYATQSGDYLRYTQYELDGLSLSVDTEEADVRIDQIQDYSVFMYSKNGFNSVVWSDGTFGYKVNATCSLPELMEIVEEIVNGSN